MKASKALFLIPLAFAQVALASQVEPSLNAIDENEPQVLAFYSQECNKMADKNALQGEKRDGFLKGCLADAPHIWPVGQDKSE